MKLYLTGMGWVTPLGSGLTDVWNKIVTGVKPQLESISNPLSNESYSVYRVPSAATSQAPAHPRLRRASAISRFAVVAGLAALEDANVKLDAANAERTALIFGISNGGVIYTRRFYHEVVEQGAQAASPLLFPETVFNAPASHLAAILGITAASYTLVGDGAVGLLAMKMAEDLLQSDSLDRCLVVAAEEADWLLCDAYKHWKLSHVILSEGAGAVLVEKNSAKPILLERIEAGCNYQRRSQAGTCLRETLRPFQLNPQDLVITSANGTFIDAIEASTLGKARTLAPKSFLGESVGASALWQIICGAQTLRDNQAPRAVISSCGMNQQIAALSLKLG